MYTKVTCELCKKEFERLTKEVTRSEKVGRKHYCSRSCARSHVNRLTPLRGVAKKAVEGTAITHNPRKMDEFSVFRDFVRRAKRRTETNITAEYLKSVFDEQGGRCPLTGVKLELPYRGSKRTGRQQAFQASLDRIDCSFGYLIGNVRFICLMANYAKGTWTDAELLEFCKRVVENCCNPLRIEGQDDVSSTLTRSTSECR